MNISMTYSGFLVTSHPTFVWIHLGYCGLYEIYFFSKKLKKRSPYFKYADNFAPIGPIYLGLTWIVLNFKILKAIKRWYIFRMSSYHLINISSYLILFLYNLQHKWPYSTFTKYFWYVWLSLLSEPHPKSIASIFSVFTRLNLGYDLTTK